MFSDYKKILFFSLVLFLSSFFCFSVLAEEQSGSLDVNYSIPGQCGNGIQEWDEACDNGVNNGACPKSCSASCTNNGSCGDGCTGDCALPVVSNIATSSISQTSAIVSWQATDDIGVSSVEFKYGTVYGTYNLSPASANNSSASLSGLTADTIYYFQIIATDTSNKKGYGYGNFRTLVIPPDTTAPNVYNINVSTDITTSSISYLTDESATSEIFYGTTIARNLSAVVSNSFVLSHSINLQNLLPNTTYHYIIRAADSLGNTTTTLDTVFTTRPDRIAPSNVSNFRLSTSTQAINLSWTNPNLQTMPDFVGVKILRKVGSYPTGYDDSSAVLVYNSSGASHVDSPVSYNTHYYYTAYTYDSSGNYSSGAQANIISASRIYTPQEVTNYYISTSTGAIILNWDNPTAQVMPYFQSVKILRKVSSAPSVYNDSSAITVYTGSGGYLEDRNNLVLNQHYYYKIFTFDGSNYSSGVVLNIIYNQPRNSEICANNIDDDNNGLVDCADSACANLSICSENNCSNNIDDDNDGLVDCLDVLDCSNDSACRTTPPENCSNSTDDDGDGFVDCADSDCTKICEQCVGVDCGGDTTAQCSDGNDNDVDGLIDFPIDPGCLSLDDDDEYNPPLTTTSTINFADIIFSVGNGQIILTPHNNTITGLSDFPLTISFPTNKIILPIKNFVLKVDGGDQYNFVENSAGNLFTAGISFPASGQKEAFLEISYDNGSFDYIRFVLESVGWGRVVDDKNNNLADVSLTLQNNAGDIINLQTYGQSNPLDSNDGGFYGWMVPNGQYKILASAEGYYTREVGVFAVGNNIVNKEIALVLEPLKLEEIIDPNASLGENILNVTENLAEKTKAWAEMTALGVKDFSNNPNVEQSAQNIVAPTAIGVVVASTLPFLNLGNLLALLRLLFLQPLLLLGKRKRVKWGQVYNALNNLPVDLAIVRLMNADTNKIVKTQVTDTKGRYAFIISEAGKYKIDVQKNDFVFPSVLLKEYKTDGQKMDLYHGEIIEVTEAGAVVAANIPMDMVGEVTTIPWRLKWEKTGRIIQKILSPLGFLFALVSYYITPKWYIGVLLILHVVLWFLFKRLAKPIRLKGWGIVYDADDKKPVTRAIARLFNLQLNKLVSTQITDKQGRYYFLAGSGKYFITVEHEGYETAHTQTIDLQGDGADVIEEKVSLHHKIDEQTPPVIPVISDIDIDSKNDVLEQPNLIDKTDKEIKPPPPENNNIFG
ncbi:MAG TPA: hypothetical protein DEB09_02045 [Candidatus Magasanikbacteria bacterium]|nr:hypothetical protein [Candidatus Magasanikbacteria bacterium]